jgi:hypothetical protein
MSDHPLVRLIEEWREELNARWRERCRLLIVKALKDERDQALRRYVGHDKDCLADVFDSINPLAIADRLLAEMSAVVVDRETETTETKGR